MTEKTKEKEKKQKMTELDRIILLAAPLTQQRSLKKALHRRQHPRTHIHHSR